MSVKSTRIVLELSRETVRELSSEGLTEVAGGNPGITNTATGPCGLIRSAAAPLSCLIGCTW
ncbi:MAG TPA: hypothetical protein VG245_01825 [Candidatus Dormibacteraeota bacterium]|jgi:hypothetical protein|nr:hypothetical protein [Candidatus Dormibacteraeota bacterium]